MKRYSASLLSNFFCKIARFIILILLVCAFSSKTYSQTTNSKTGKSWVDLKEKTVIEYDKNTDKYVFYHIEGGRKTHPFKIMNSDEFDKYQIQNSIRNSWIEQRGKADEDNQNRENRLIPKTKVDNRLFETIFGGNEIEITPQGSAELIFRADNNKTTNPMIPENYRSSTSFDFDTKLQFNVVGKIGDRVNMNFNYNTDATFDFETQLKVGYNGGEDDIIQKIEVGNVSFPLSGTLISGAQSLFGLRTDLKFGKLKVSGIVSKQESKSQTLEIKGGTQINQFEIKADQYDANRHFFLSQVFRDNYEKYLKNLPYVRSDIEITRLEVWVTNKSSKFDDSRSILGFVDLAEPAKMHQYSRFVKAGAPKYAANNANKMLEVLDVNAFRNIANVTTYLNSNNMVSGSDYEKLENARKLTEGTDYTLNPQLGFISLNSALNNDEVLCVAYEYTMNGTIYKVGELSTDGINSPNVLVTKLIKGTSLTPKMPTWDLMMKNVYSISSMQFTKDEFVLDVYYQDDKAGTELTYLPEGAVKNVPLIRVLNSDNLNSANEAQPDGIFDFVEGITVISQRGKIIFPVVEPFGSYLRKKINNDAIAQKYVYQELYDSTLVKAQEVAEKNKFSIKGSYKAEGSSEIFLNASNVPEGSVSVTCGGVKLVENVDYTVNYTMGSVNIINPAYLQSGMSLKVSLEDNSLFSMQQKTMFGVHFDYEINKDFSIGATYLRLHEKPMLRKVSYGEDPISNSIFGLNLSYRKESPFLTKMIDKIPFLNTKESSFLSIDAEYAKLMTGQSTKNSYIDDFEASRTSVDLKAFSAWTLASTPQKQPDIFPEGELSNDIANGFNRAKFAWYSISTDFTRNTGYTPGYIKSNPAYRENHFVREIQYKEIFPEKDIKYGTSEYLSTLNMAFYPDERGPYNFDVKNVGTDGKFTNPEKRWGGIMRALSTTDFEAANYGHIEFWMMDPFVYNQNSTGGEMFFDLGDISEDILRDGMKSFEHGLPYPFDPTKVVETAWGRVPTIQSLVYTFDNNVKARPYQDVGLDGLSDEDEAIFYNTKYKFLDNLSFLNTTAFEKISKDPSSDNFRHYLDRSFDESQANILDRYKDYNGLEGNSSVGGSIKDQNRMSTPNPDMEDINRDNTMNESENYFQYKLKLTPANMVVGKNFISDVREVEVDFKNGGGPSKVRWFQFKIPLSEYQKKVGDINDFKSIRFMRMFVRGFKEPTYFRFATLDLVRSEWRKYNYSMIEGQEGLAQPEMANANFEISVVNIEENSNRQPVNYVMPPGIKRELDYNGGGETTEMNEQAMEYKFIDLDDGEGRAAYKNMLYDLRQFRRIKMDVHAEAIPGYPLKDQEVSLFVRMGNDYRNNYYEYEIPLSLTPYRSTYSNRSDADRLAVWPKENRLDLELQKFVDLKLERNRKIKTFGGSTSTAYEKMDGKNKMRIVGNPDLGSVKVLMIGVRNPKKVTGRTDDGQPKSAVVWVNEFRLSDYENEGGWAATARAQAQLADLGSVTLAGTVMTPGFGGLEQKYSERIKDDIFEYNIMTNLELGKFFPEKWGVRIPLFFGYSAHTETPKYNPFDKDVTLKRALDELTGKSRDSLENMTENYIQQKSFNLSNVRISPQGRTKSRVFDIANLSLTYAYTQQYRRNATTAENLYKNYSAIISYSYNVSPKYWQPFKSLKPKWMTFFKELNINPYPNQFSFTSQVNRYYNEITTRSISAPDIVIPTTYSKDFTWERKYSFLYDITKNLKMDFNATNLARIDEPEGMVNKHRDPDGYRHWRDSVWSNFWNFGRNVQYNHSLQFTWQLPLNRIAFLDWIKNTQLSYRAGYEWVAAARRQIEDYDPGNVISNTQTISFVTNADMTSLYNKIPMLKRINDEFDGRTKPKTEMRDVKFESKRMTFFANRKRTINHNLGTLNVEVKMYDKEGKEIKGTVNILDKNRLAVTFNEEYKAARVEVSGKVPKPQPVSTYLAKSLARLAMSLKSVEMSYTQQGATTLPGFKGESKFLGMSKINGELSPGWNFILGRQSSDYINDARNNQWLTTDTTFSEPFLMTQTRNFTLKVRLQPIKDFNIDLMLQRQKSATNVRFTVINPNGISTESGTFNITVISIGSAFENPTANNGYKSKAFDKFLKSRKEIAWNLAGERAAKSQTGYNPGSGEYPDGYGKFSQEVLVNSFMKAYAGMSSSKFENFKKIPLPNWNISYSGLSKLPALEQFVNTAIIQHSYRSVYSVNSYTTNQLFDPGADGLSYVKNTLGDFVPNLQMMNVSIREAMNPLIKIDVAMKNMLLANVEINRTRTVSLSLSNNQITEARSVQYVIGCGYMFDNLPQIFNIAGITKRNDKTTLRLRGDFSYREDLSIIRKLDGTNTYSQIGDGRKIVAFTATADYAIGNNISLRMFLERQLNEPYVSAISNRNISFGFSLRFSLTQ